jgi:hypothetical protein
MVCQKKSNLHVGSLDNFVQGTISPSGFHNKGAKSNRIEGKQVILDHASAKFTLGSGRETGLMKKEGGWKTDYNTAYKWVVPKVEN